MKLVALATIAFVVVTIACLDPTEIIVELSTDVPCTSFTGADIGFQYPNQTTVSIVTHAVECSGAGTIGSLVIVPAQSNDEVLSIIVTTTTNVSSPDDCMSAPGPACIVARRKLAFEPHATLKLPIFLDSACAGIACDPTTTCSQGLCVPN